MHGCLGMIGPTLVLTVYIHTYIRTHMHVCVRMYVCIQACMYARGRVERQIQHEAKPSAGFAGDPTPNTV